MSDAWSMDLTGHTPSFGAPPEAGKHLLEIVEAQPQAKGSKDGKKNYNRVVFTYKVIDSSSAASKGRTFRDFMAVIDGEFEGSKGHADVSRDQWAMLLMALGVKLGKAPMNKLAAKMVGMRFGAETGVRLADLEPGQDADDPNRRKYADIKAWFPADAYGSVGSAPETEEDDESSDDVADEASEVDDTDADASFDLDAIA